MAGEADNEGLKVTGSYVPLFGYRFFNSTVDGLLGSLHGDHAEGKNPVVLFCTAHMLWEASRNPLLAQALSRADYLCPDGMPISWAMRFLAGARPAERLRGPDISRRLLKTQDPAPQLAFYGGSPEALDRIKEKFYAKNGAEGPVLLAAPPLSSEKELVENDFPNRLKTLGPNPSAFWLIGLGCPKQELFSHSLKSKALVKGPILAVGAAFDFLAGTKAEAPLWMQRGGLEWLFRLISEPGRLWKRYLVGNIYFLWICLRHALFREHNKREF